MCRHAGCSAVVEKPGYCEAHAQDASGWQRDKTRGTRKQRGYGPAWDRKRKRILERDGYMCQCADCRAEDRPLLASEVDHILPKAEGGTDADENLQAINHDCHKRKTDGEKLAGRARAAARPWIG